MTAHYPFLRPTLPPPDRWTPYLADSYRSGRFSNGGPVVRQLERRMTEWLGHEEREAVAVASGTAGLIAALLAIGVRGAIALPAFTFSATAHAVRRAGCTPVFVDVDPGRWELCPASLSEAIEREPLAAVIHVRSYGLCRDLRPLEDVCRRAGLPLIVDSAAALGGRLDDGRMAGGDGHAEVFSMHVTKPMGIGEGGLVVAPPELASDLRAVVNFGHRSPTRITAGLNGKMSDITAAVGLAVHDDATERLDVRRRFAAAYRTVLEAVPLTLPAEPGDPPWQTFPVVTGSSQRATLAGALAKAGIETRDYYSPSLARSAAFSDGAKSPLPATDQLTARALCLPVYNDTEDLRAMTELVGETVSSAELERPA